MTGTVKTMGTNLTLRQPNRINQDFQRIELQGCQTESLTDFFHHPFILRRVGSGILVQILVLITFQFLDDTTLEVFEVTLRRTESNEIG